jgi:hypothetical protein
MKKTFIFGMVLIVMMICVSSAAAQDTVTRDLPSSADADTTITVNLTVDVVTTAGTLLITEEVPSGWTVVSATNDGDYATLAGYIYWTKLSSVTDATYSYTIQIPADASGTYTFNGTYMFDTMTDCAIIPGDTELTVGAELPEPKLISCVIDPAPPVEQGTNITVDCLFSEKVTYEICIENATGDLVEEIGSGTAKNPDPKWWNTTTGTLAGTYTVNVTMDNSTSGLSSYNNTNTIEVTAAGDTTPPAITTVANTTPTTDSVTITWDTDEGSDSLVKYGTVVGTYTAEEYDATITASHSIALTGLDADTTYYFVVNSTDASGNSAESEEHNFTTSVMIATSPMTVEAVPNSVVKDTPTDVLFNVTSDGSPVDGALVTLLGCGVDTNGTTGPDGTVTISVTATSTGTITVTVTNAGYDDATTTVDVTLIPMTVTAVPTSMLRGTTTNVTFNVTSEGTPVGDAFVTLLGCGVDVNGTTDENGTVTISVTATSTGTILVTATKDTYEDATTTVAVTAPSNGGSSGGSGGGTYPPGWNDPVSTPAATPAATPEPTVAPAEAPTVAQTEAPTKAPTPKSTEITTTELKTEGGDVPDEGPGFGAVLTVFAIAGLLVAAYLVMRRRE